MNIKPRTIKNVHARRAAICVFYPIASIAVFFVFLFCATVSLCCAISEALKCFVDNGEEYAKTIINAAKDIPSMWRSDFEARDK